MNHEQFHQSIFWLYYAKGILQAKLKQHNDAIASFTACLDAGPVLRIDHFAAT